MFLFFDLFSDSLALPHYDFPYQQLNVEKNEKYLKEMKYRVHYVLIPLQNLPKSIAWKFRNTAEIGKRSTCDESERQVQHNFSERCHVQLSAHSVILQK